MEKARKNEGAAAEFIDDVLEKLVENLKAVGISEDEAVRVMQGLFKAYGSDGTSPRTGWGLNGFDRNGKEKIIRGLRGSASADSGQFSFEREIWNIRTFWNRKR